MSAAPKVQTIVHALALVTAAHKAKLPEISLMASEAIARDEGATRAEVRDAATRGFRQTLRMIAPLLVAASLVACRPAPAASAAAVVTPPSDTAVAIPAGTRIPGRFLGMSQGAEVWDMGDFTVRVRRVAR